MSETPPIQPLEKHTNKEETGFLARMLGFVKGRTQAGAAAPEVKNLADRVKRLGPEAASAAIDAAIAAYSDELTRQEQSADK